VTEKANASPQKDAAAKEEGDPAMKEAGAHHQKAIASNAQDNSDP